MIPIVIRDLLSTDLTEIRRLSADHQGDYSASGLQQASGGDVAVLGVFYNGVLIGKGGIDFTISSGAGRIWMLTVDEDHRSQGLGSALIHALECVAAERRVDKTELLVEIDNERAKRLYERLGYEVVDEVIDVVKERDVDGRSFDRKAPCFRLQRRVEGYCD